MITCDYSYAPDCSQCDEPVCLRHVQRANDWEDALSEPTDYHED